MTNLPTQLAIPMRVDASTGQMVKVTQNSQQEIIQSAVVVTQLRRNQVLGNENIGIDDPTFGPREVDTAAIKAAMTRSDPRIRANISEKAIDDLTEAVLIEVQGVNS